MSPDVQQEHLRAWGRLAQWVVAGLVIVPLVGSFVIVPAALWLASLR